MSANHPQGPTAAPEEFIEYEVEVTFTVVATSEAAASIDLEETLQDLHELGRVPPFEVGSVWQAD
ncbi:MAG TPA: hypothetical protein VHD87_15420 [Acidimicrobiales bacterium]|nr:hypothetical protein [Acidimicrobiales bacterium]